MLLFIIASRSQRTGCMQCVHSTVCMMHDTYDTRIILHKRQTHFLDIGACRSVCLYTCLHTFEGSAGCLVYQHLEPKLLPVLQSIKIIPETYIPGITQYTTKQQSSDLLFFWFVLFRLFSWYICGALDPVATLSGVRFPPVVWYPRVCALFSYFSQGYSSSIRRDAFTILYPR